MKSMPTEWPRAVDRAALLKLKAKLADSTELVGFTGHTNISKKKKQVQEKRMDGCVTISRSRVMHDGYQVKFNGINKKGLIDNPLPLDALVQIVDDLNISDLVIDSEAVLREPTKNCAVCDQHGLENVISYQYKKRGAGNNWILPTQSPAKYMMQQLRDHELDHLYPPREIAQHLRSVLITEDLKGHTGSKMLDWNDFLPPKYGYGIAEKLQEPWIAGKFHMDIFYPSWGCGPTYQSKLTGAYFGATPAGSA